MFELKDIDSIFFASSFFFFRTMILLSFLTKKARLDFGLCNILHITCNESRVYSVARAHLSAYLSRFGRGYRSSNPFG